jgi:DNA-binding transcriptional regulator YhcF (GntR family)
MADERKLVSGAAKHEQIARIIRNDIEANKLRHGQKLPSDREQAEQFGVSSPIVAKAMKLLTDEGLILSKPRSGRVVNAPDQLQTREVKTSMPHLILIGGYAGSGKSELGRTLARLTSWAMVDKDTTTRPVVEKTLEVMGTSPNDRESDIYLNEVRPREYEAMMATIAENLPPLQRRQLVRRPNLVDLEVVDRPSDVGDALITPHAVATLDEPPTGVLWCASRASGTGLLHRCLRN